MDAFVLFLDALWPCCLQFLIGLRIVVALIIKSEDTGSSWRSDFSFLFYITKNKLNKTTKKI